MKRPRLDRKRCSQGVTLVELMIAMALSIVLLGGTIAIFLSSKQAYRTQEDLARIQENFRYGVNRFIREVSAAGFMGCAGSVQKANATVTNTFAGTDFTSLIDGQDDILTLRYARAESGVPVVAAMTGQMGDVIVDKDHPNYTELKKDDVVAVSDCDAIAVFQIDEVSAGTLKHGGKDLEHVFGSGDWASAMVYKMGEIAFKLGAKTAASGKTLSSLYVRWLGGNWEPILAGVEDFQVLYGIDLAPKDGTADRYLAWDDVPADQVNEITSLHITMTVNPGLPVNNATGENAGFRKTTEFTVKLRNRTGDA